MNAVGAFAYANILKPSYCGSGTLLAYSHTDGPNSGYACTCGPPDAVSTVDLTVCPIACTEERDTEGYQISATCTNCGSPECQAAQQRVGTSTYLADGGVDCSEIPFVSDVECVNGACVVGACLPGTVLMDGKCEVL
ncbi:hypothetical protein MNV49_001930 [Pseudohyphozyma bogoriensis]|nr:hypothetical protein MNV49_001930 [Pseudohyphozyma bogoriensis]